MANKSPSTELGAISTVMKLASASSSSSSLATTINSTNLSSKINKIPSNIVSQESSSFNFLLRSETNQDSPSSSEKKCLTVSSID